jgi:hypothetical protein
MEKQYYIFWECVCSLSYPACEVHAACYIVIVACLALPYFLTVSKKWHDFRKNVIGHKICVLIFSTIFIRNISHYKKNSARYCHKFENVFMLSTRYSYQIWKKIEFCRQIFEKFWNIKFNYNPKVGNELFHADILTDGWTYGQAWRYFHFSQFC